tara:strand:- start:2028 stop:2420 length:393 start_codon:yes stop_codon:yes gene_type:complete
MNEKLSILSELIKLSKIDKSNKEEEYSFISMIAESLAVSKDQLDMLFSEYAEYAPPKLEIGRILQLQRLILLANIDMEVDKTEKNLIFKAGIRLGLRPESIESVLIKMKDYPGGMIPENELISIFKSYHN